MITFEGLSFSYGNMNEEQLKSLNLQIERGEFVLLCGRSACGKTTATKCIFVKGKDVANTPIYGSLRRYSPAHECIKAQRVPCGRNFTRGRFPDNGRRTLFAFNGYWPGSG